MRVRCRIAIALLQTSLYPAFRDTIWNDVKIWIKFQEYWYPNCIEISLWNLHKAKNSYNKGATKKKT